MPRARERTDLPRTGGCRRQRHRRPPRVAARVALGGRARGRRDRRDHGRARAVRLPRSRDGTVAGVPVRLAVSDELASADIPLVDIIDRLLDRGVVLAGAATISVAGVDLIELKLNVVLASVDALERAGAR